MNLKQKVAQGVAWSIIQKWGREIITFITFVILSRLLPPDAFGLVAMAAVFTSFIEIFLDQGLGAAIVQRLDLEGDHLHSAFWINVLTGVLLTVGSIISAGLVTEFYQEPRLAPILRWLSLSFILVALSSTQIALLQRRLSFKSLAVRSLVANLVGGIVGIGMAVSGFGVWSLVGQNLANSLAGVIVLWSASKWRPKFYLSKKHFMDLFGYGLSIVGEKILLFFTRRSDDFLIGYYLGPTMLGYYTIGYRLLLVLIRLLTGITNSVAFPTFSRIQHEPERMRRAFYQVTQYTSLLAFPSFIGLAVLAPELVSVVFGDQWIPSIPVMQVLALIGILQSVLFFNGSLIKASGKPSWNLGIMFLTTVCSVVGFLIAVRWGIVAVAISFVIAGYLVAPASYLAVHKLIKIDIRTYFQQFLAPLSACLFMVITIMGLKHLIDLQGLNLYLELAVYLLAGILAYLIVIFITARTLATQIMDLIRIVLPKGISKKRFS